MSTGCFYSYSNIICASNNILQVLRICQNINNIKKTLNDDTTLLV